MQVLALGALSNLEHLNRISLGCQNETNSLYDLISGMVQDSCEDVRLSAWKLLKGTEPTLLPAKLIINAVQNGVQDRNPEINDLAKSTCKQKW